MSEAAVFKAQGSWGDYVLSVKSDKADAAGQGWETHRDKARGMMPSVAPEGWDGGNNVICCL